MTQYPGRAKVCRESRCTYRINLYHGDEKIRHALRLTRWGAEFHAKRMLKWDARLWRYQNEPVTWITEEDIDGD